MKNKLNSHEVKKFGEIVIITKRKKQGEKDLLGKKMEIQKKRMMLGTTKIASDYVTL